MIMMHFAPLLCLASAGLQSLHAFAAATTDELEAIQERLQALDAERSALHQRLAMANGGHKEKDAAITGDGLAEVLERLVQDLAPLLPEVALELSLLACAGVLLYCVGVFRSQSGFSRPKTKSVEASSVPVTATCTQGFSIAQTTNCHGNTSPKKWNVTKEREMDNGASHIGPPPGLSLDPVDDCVVVPPIDLCSESSDPEAEVDVPQGSSDPGPPPGLSAQAPVSASGSSEARVEHSDNLEHAAIASQNIEVHIEPPACLEPSSLVMQTLEAKSTEAELANTTEQWPSVDVASVPARSDKCTKTQKRAAKDGNRKSKSEAPAKEASDEVSECKQSRARLADQISHYLPRFLRKHQELIDEEFNIDLDTPASKKRTEPRCSDKANKKKGKQQHKTGSPKPMQEDNPCPRFLSNRPHWPCSLPLTVAITFMFIVILFGHISPQIDPAHEALAEKKQLLEELQTRKSGLQRKVALLELQDFAANAQHAISTLPAVHTKKLADMKADSEKLYEALQEVPEADFPQVEESFQTVLAGWKRSLNDAHRLASLQSGDGAQCRSRKEDATFS
jgi:hypothetical protein